MVVPGDAAADRPDGDTQQPETGWKILLTPQIERPADQTVIRRFTDQIGRTDWVLPATITLHSSTDMAIAGSPGLVATRTTECDVHAESGRNWVNSPELSASDRGKSRPYRNSELESRQSCPSAGPIPDAGNRAGQRLSSSFWANWPSGRSSSTSGQRPRSSAARPECCAHRRRISPEFG